VAEKTNDHPAWLKAMQNGSIGEARSRAFLLERFWVLERSVDIDGADLIIQRRITSRNLLDREAPRLGVVQVKFFGTPGTSHYVHEEYVLDAQSKPRNEFFLLAHWGGEDNSRAFLLSAEEIKQDFTVTEHSGSKKYYLPWAQVEAKGRYEIKSRTRALDRIEQRLELADFTANRRFMSWMLPSVDADLAAIQPEYREKLGNYWGDIPEGFKDLKKSARKGLIDVEEIYEKLRGVVEATDPLVAEELIDDIRYQCRNGMGKWSISLPDDLDNEDLFNVSKAHRAKVRKLKKEGMLDAFIGMINELQKQVIEFLAPHFPIKHKWVCRLKVDYNPTTLALKGVDTELLKPEDAPKMKDPDWNDAEIKELKHGRFEVLWKPGNYGIAPYRQEPTVEMFRAFDFPVFWVTMDFVYTAKYGEPEVK
jgi:hypothetical protein